MIKNNTTDVEKRLFIAEPTGLYFKVNSLLLKLGYSLPSNDDFAFTDLNFGSSFDPDQSVTYITPKRLA